MYSLNTARSEGFAPQAGSQLILSSFTHLFRRQALSSVVYSLNTARSEGFAEEQGNHTQPRYQCKGRTPRTAVPFVPLSNPRERRKTAHRHDPRLDPRKSRILYRPTRLSRYSLSPIHDKFINRYSILRRLFLPKVGGDGEPIH